MLHEGTENTFTINGKRENQAETVKSIQMEILALKNKIS